ncbi:MAG: ATP-dependent protease subunit HslV [Abditibacteriota bacterium]|nr:ATP-dependent protease subunit HslV [Abditibacteriota bacterium]
MDNRLHATTIIAVKKGHTTAIAGDGQVTLGNTVFKASARKIRRIFDDRIMVGFAGSVADAQTLCDKFESKVRESNGILKRAVIEFAKEWRSDKILRNFEAMMIVADKDYLLVLSGNGEVLEPDEGIAAIGSGGMYAAAAAKALVRNTELDPLTIVQESMKAAADICIYTNHNIISDVLE